MGSTFVCPVCGEPDGEERVGCQLGAGSLGIATFKCKTPRSLRILNLKLAFPLTEELHLARQESRASYLALDQLGFYLLSITPLGFHLRSCQWPDAAPGAGRTGALPCGNAHPVNVA